MTLPNEEQGTLRGMSVCTSVHCVMILSIDTALLQVKSTALDSEELKAELPSASITSFTSDIDHLECMDLYHAVD